MCGVQFQGNGITRDGFVELLEEELFVLFLELCIHGRLACCGGIRCVLTWDCLVLLCFLLEPQCSFE